jgi:hypothetical protein
VVDRLELAAQAALLAASVLILEVALVLSFAMFLGLTGMRHCLDLRPS